MNTRFGASLPLVKPALAVAVGIVVGRLSGFAVPIWVVCLPMGLILLLSVSRLTTESRWPLKSLLLIVAFMLLGMCRFSSTQAILTEVREAHFHGRLLLDGNCRCTQHRCRVPARTSVVNDTSGMESIKLELVLPIAYEAVLTPGSIVETTGMMTRFHEAANPFQYDPLERAKEQGLAGQLKADSIVVIHPAPAGWRWRGQRWLWAGLSGIENPRVRGMSYALLTGDKSELDPQLRTVFARCGTMHLLAVSGLHAGLVAWIPMLLMRRYRQRYWAIPLFVLVIGVVWGFAWFTGLSASVIRAAAMLSMMALGLLLRKRVSTLNSLAAAALFMLLSEPKLLFNAGFLLSFLAVAAIVCFTPIIRAQVPVFRRRWLNGIMNSSSVTLAAQAGTTPVSLYFFHQLPLLFLPANLIAVPLGTLLLYLLMLHAILLSFGIDLNALTWLITQLGHGLIIASEAISGISWAALEGVGFGLAASLLLALLLIVIFRILATDEPRNWWPALFPAIALIIAIPQNNEAHPEIVVFSQFKGIGIGLSTGSSAYVIADEEASDFAFGGWQKRYKASVHRVRTDTIFHLDGWRVEHCNGKWSVGPLLLLPETDNVAVDSLGGWRLKRKWRSWLLIHPEQKELKEWNWDEKALHLTFR